jgi:hypothetical protein
MALSQNTTSGAVWYARSRCQKETEVAAVL